MDIVKRQTELASLVLDIPQPLSLFAARVRYHQDELSHQAMDRLVHPSLIPVEVFSALSYNYLLRLHKIK